MKMLLLVVVTLASMCAQAEPTWNDPNEITCSNLSTHEEDSLVLNLQKMTASYFDNDTWRDLTCVNSEKDNAILCHQVNDNESLLTRINRNGSSVVTYSQDQLIDFQCALPASNLPNTL
jgi:hypothetical protein